MNAAERIDTYLTADQIRMSQEGALQSLLMAVLGENEFYTRKLRDAGIRDSGASFELKDLRTLPFTTKEELAEDQRANPPYGTNLTYPLRRYVRLHQSSGTKGGRPLRWLDTAGSWEWFMRCWELIYKMAGVREDDRFFFPFSFGPFIGFWAGFEAAVRGGHLTIPGGGMATTARLRMILDNGVTVIGCTPTYAMHMAEVAEREGIDLAGSAVRMVIVAGEPGGSIPEVRGRIERGWGARVIDHCGMTEIGSLGIECGANPGGLHLIETECIAEILDPETGESVGPGGRGELVLTNLGRTGSPLIRYRTGDLVEVDPDPCPCGCAFIRLRGGILARADDMVVIRGNNVYPAAIEAILRRFDPVLEYQATVAREEGLAVLRLDIECDPGIGSNETPLAESVARAIKDELQFRPEVRIAAPGALPRYEMKARRFVIDSSYKRENP